MVSSREVTVAGRFWLAAFVIAAAGVLACGCGRGAGDDSRPAEEGSSLPEGTSVAASDPTSREASSGSSVASGTVVTAGFPVLLDLGADKCVPCKVMAPILEEMKETFEGQLDVRFIDVWKDASAAREFGVKIIPTQIFFDGEGNELFRHQGFFSREDMLAKWAELGYVFEE
ncbi:MAG: thioredoxin family protein [Candidatus Eisenbacteria bacterium]